MHQSKKEKLIKFWDKKIDFSIQENTNKEEIIEEKLGGIEPENISTISNIKNNR